MLPLPFLIVQNHNRLFRCRIRIIGRKRRVSTLRCSLLLRDIIKIKYWHDRTPSPLFHLLNFLSLGFAFNLLGFVFNSLGFTFLS